MTEPEAFLTAAALVPEAFAAAHDALLRDGREPDVPGARREPPQLAELVAWLPVLMIEACLDALLARERPSLPAAALWITDAALTHEDPAQARATRAAAATLARAQLADSLAHPDGDPLPATVRRFADALALALETNGAPAQRQTAITAAHAELLALAFLRRRPLPHPRTDRPNAHAPGPAPGTMSAVAVRALRTARPAHYRRALRHGAAAVARARTGERRSDIAGVVRALPDLALDAIWLQTGADGYGGHAERDWLAHAHARAAAALWHAEQALDPQLRRDPMTLELARDRLDWIAAARDHEQPVLDCMYDCAEWLATLLAGKDDKGSDWLGLAAGQLLVMTLLTRAPLRVGRLNRPCTHRAGRQRARRGRA